MGVIALYILATAALLVSGVFMHLAGILTARSERPTGTAVLFLIVGGSLLGAAWWAA
jgi:hypothetical protein